MSPRAPLSAVFSILILVQSGCLFHRHPKAGQAAYVPLPIPVGTVSLVNDEGRFVLVDHGTMPGPPAGGVLKCFPSGGETASAELVATSVRRRPFTIADIRKGTPHKGERVIYYPPELQRPVGAAGTEVGAAAAPVPSTLPR